MQSILLQRCHISFYVGPRAPSHATLLVLWRFVDVRGSCAQGFGSDHPWSVAALETAIGPSLFSLRRTRQRAAGRMGRKPSCGSVSCLVLRAEIRKLRWSEQISKNKRRPADVRMETIIVVVFANPRITIPSPLLPSLSPQTNPLHTYMTKMSNASFHVDTFRPWMPPCPKPLPPRPFLSLPHPATAIFGTNRPCPMENPWDAALSKSPLLPLLQAQLQHPLLVRPLPEMCLTKKDQPCTPASSGCQTREGSVLSACLANVNHPSDIIGHPQKSCAPLSPNIVPDFLIDLGTAAVTVSYKFFLASG